MNQFKKEDGNLYAIYGTPAESLCGLQIEQFRKLYGIVENVSDRSPVSNSFHCHVTEEITPIEKQNSEARFWNLSNGGKIQYVRYPVSYNKEAIRTLVRRAMKLGLYEGVNLSLAYCDDCGYQQLEMDVCPRCGSTNLTKIDRMNGYLSLFPRPWRKPPQRRENGGNCGRRVCDMNYHNITVDDMLNGDGLRTVLWVFRLRAPLPRLPKSANLGRLQRDSV